MSRLRASGSPSSGSGRREGHGAGRDAGRDDGRDDGRGLAELRAGIERAGYFPALVADSVVSGLAGEPVDAHLVHQETTFDGDEVRRHVTVLAVTPTRLLVGHTDDHGEQGADDRGGPAAGGRGAGGGLQAAGGGVRPDLAAHSAVATTSCEAVALERVHSVVVSRTVADPASYRPGQLPTEVTLTLGWGVVRRIELEPASCGDPSCEADHGYSGTAAAEDIAVRVSAAAEGADAVRRALDFAATLSTLLTARAR